MDLGGKKFAGLLGEIKQHRAGFEDRDRLAAALRLMIDHRGDAVVRRDRQKLRLELLALADVDCMRLIGEIEFLKRDGSLAAVGCGPSVEINHD